MSVIWQVSIILLNFTDPGKKKMVQVTEYRNINH